MKAVCRWVLWIIIFSLGPSIAVLTTVGAAHGCASDSARPMPAGRNEAIARAKKELARRGYPVSKMVVEADESNRKWQTYQRSTPDFVSQHPSELAKLEGKKYWAVYLAPASTPNTIQGGGDAFVFVDAATGAILSVILFK